jgi:UDP-N-acetylmuramate dehydrogenase
VSLERLKERLSSLLGVDELRFGEPMSRHTSFRVGGPADVWARPSGPDAEQKAGRLLRIAREESVPVFILGGGANLVVADAGIRGLALDSGGLASLAFDPAGGDAAFFSAGAGLSMDDAVEACAARSLGGLEFLAGMPGTVRGRCDERPLLRPLGIRRPFGNGDP